MSTLKTNSNINKKQRFKNKDTENFYLGEKVLKFQELSKSDKQDAHRKVVLVRQAKNWKEIILYFPFGASGSRLEKLSKNQFSIRLSKQYRLLFKWDKKKQFAYDIEINPHNKRYGK
ncbi:type II toxin-antitoxin system RelE/ParE family toxin [endosymbiont GvMRE of Glomus versiforme]|uniref:type II toxin-antitoxin system RelE/ParE family toxin n=1 Tax=endosymbiont GvMRE of Glomus versiforme TaxID=2039283 RepID=UPI000EC89E57|nr:type II toxin-antitoxin system RelE/ParE family toxin [endosymbiont GvMRE of Glomus versiforme]RHZ36795.1 Plasmid maintenance system killer protein [endosymbiont GvMRE of Glomus versiforme]